MATREIVRLSKAVREVAEPLTRSAFDYGRLLDLIGNARFVLIGEATHGTHEFYRERAEITQWLIRERGFNAVAVEADWPDAYRVNRYVRGMGDPHATLDALAGFERFPTWMWRNLDVLDFIGWLRACNDSLDPGAVKAGFYGLDLYSLHRSIRAVLDYLDKVDPEAARRARYRYSCLEDFGEDPQAYGFAASFDLGVSCEREAVEQLVELQRRAADYASRDGRVAADEFFFAEQSARLVRNAEEYYRNMFAGPVASWNLRDTHMADTLDALAGHLERQYGRAKIVVWAHNSHVGDASATQMGSRGEINLGQLARRRHAGETVLIGQTTFEGAVTAATDWDGPAERMRVRPALPGSVEEMLHEVGYPRFLLALDERDSVRAALAEPRLERAIGVVYRPRSEPISHYFDARLRDQFDIVLHFDHTSALEPLERTGVREREKEWETFPSGV
jgi:erythromycin esterase-like protein